MILSFCHCLEQKGWGYSFFWTKFKMLFTTYRIILKVTTLTILDLFFNQPVRKKFAKSGCFKFVNLDEVVRRLSLF
ncbi:hypothetical protein [Buchnera aphidicola]|uniref:Uncharacterized protein n=1 Tax=Buchnera aphidicola subsp. Melaphis rhois TaxID=118103 RepID=A0A4D6Y4K8_BUCMH|nr:hypothetical protein [Buchnera aphidicola]QCI23523.1 hypothetical protein D9V73_02705 [Buchnera aphidicola (Melaphis rhois)]